ncbi:SDR family NAD(P)-dependent oxidoreductase [Chloroflexota bacterium]
MGLERFALTDRIAIVTGASQGLGEAIALAMAEAGAHVVVASRNKENLQKVAKEIEKLGRKSLVVPTDVTVTSQVENMVSKTVDEFGRVDIMVNNAGGIAVSAHQLHDPSLMGSVRLISEETWDKVFTVNLRATFVCSKTVAPLMLSQGKGNIINLSSMAGLMPYPLWANYGAAKAGVSNLTESLAAEFAPNIRVNAIAPGVMATPTVSEAYRNNPELAEKRLKMILLMRLGLPEEIAYPVIFLASDASSFITGQTIRVSGGLTTFV